MMLRRVLTPLAALTLCTCSASAMAAPAESPKPWGMERMQHWAVDHEALLNAKLAGLKAGSRSS
jgi:hypothetical protein